MASKTKTKAAKKVPAPAKTAAAAPAPAGEDWFNTSFTDLRRQMDRLFDSFAGGWHLPSIGAPLAMPRWAEGTIAVQFDVSETDDSYEISAELPGLEEKDVEVSLEGDLLTVKGEKKAESEKKKKDYYVMERHYGAFRRSFRLPETVDDSKIKASFDKGVLHLTLPKAAEAKRKAKKIEISRA
ncbi:MAG: Hsp20/alpha crystallin family protein [Rhodospirillales bacterium]|nr:Hsp20/alpha crystallin family protein [Rhodospirillales bacterium]